MAYVDRNCEDNLHGWCCDDGDADVYEIFLQPAPLQTEQVAVFPCLPGKQSILNCQW